MRPACQLLNNVVTQPLFHGMLSCSELVGPVTVRCAAQGQTKEPARTPAGGGGGTCYP